MTTNATRDARLRKFQDLPRELFQVDCADLDFGIYRIMNHKRDAVETFVTQELPAAVDAELSKGVRALEAQATAELAEAAQAVRENIDDSAIDAAGVFPEPRHGTGRG